MNNTTGNHSTSSRTRQLITTVRDDLRERRQVRAEQRLLERQIATYATPHEIDDLLASLSRDDSVEADRMRSMLTRNMQHSQRTSVAS